jgi:hypothetical protein
MEHYLVRDQVQLFQHERLARHHQQVNLSANNDDWMKNMTSYVVSDIETFSSPLPNDRRSRSSSGIPRPHSTISVAGGILDFIRVVSSLLSHH